jgi:hypothetical protein
VPCQYCHISRWRISNDITHRRPKLVVLTGDESLPDRIAHALGDSGSVTSAGNWAELNAVAVAGRADTLVVDARADPSQSLRVLLDQLRISLDDSTRVIGITSRPVRSSIQVLTRVGGRGLDILIADSDPIPDLVCALALDPSRTAAAAIAADILARHLQPRAFRVASRILSNGFRSSTVKEIARAERVSPDTIERWLASEGSPKPKLVIRLVRCLYAAILRTAYGVSWSRIAQWARFGKPQALRAQIRNTLGNAVNLEWFADHHAVGRLHQALERRCAQWLAEHSRPIAGLISSGVRAGTLLEGARSMEQAGRQG